MLLKVGLRERVMQTVKIDIAKLNKDLSAEIEVMGGLSVVRVSTLLAIIAQAIESANEENE